MMKDIYNAYKVSYWIETQQYILARMLLLHLWNKRHRQYWKSDVVEFLIADTGLERRALYKAIGKLEDEDYLMVERKQHKSIPYKVNLITSKFIQFHDKKRK